MKILRNNKIYYFLVAFSLLFSICITNFYKNISIYTENDTKFEGLIIDKNFNGNKLSFTIKAKEKIVGTYYIDSLKEKTYLEKNFRLGYKVKLIGKLNHPKNNTIQNGFNYKKYLYNNQIYWTLSTNKILNIDKSNNILYKIKNRIIDRIENFNYSKNYLYAFILGDTSKIEGNVLSSYQTNGISHLFAVSGMHVSLITSIIFFLLKKLRIKENTSIFILSIILLFYVFLTGFSPSVLRASLLFVFLKINKVFNFKFETIHIMLLIFSITLLINPYYIYNISFQYSYLICTVLILFKNILKNYKNYFLKTLIVSLIAFLVGLPITMYNFYQINIISVFLNLLFVPLISFIIFPFSIITFIIPKLELINNYLLYILEHISLLVSNIKIFNFSLAKPSMVVMILYVLFIIIILKKLYNEKYKSLVLLFIILLIHTNISYFNNKPFIITIDVGQGDSSLIVLPNNKGNILIDTGGITTFNNEEWKKIKKLYSISNDTTIPMLKSFGIKSLDYLILTHGDFDHMGDAINLVNNFKVEKVIFNNGEFNDLELKLIEVLEKKNIPYYQNIKELNIGYNKLYFLNNKVYDNENDNSIVLYTKINNHKLLLMGDAGVEVEEDLLDKYNLEDIDILKVGHHGSKTSSSEEFIDNIEPKYSIISVGKNNRYGHPNNEVLKILENSNIYRTDQDGSTMFKFNKNKLEVNTCPP